MDAAHYASHPATAVSANDNSGDDVRTVTVKTKSIVEAEETAITPRMTS